MSQPIKSTLVLSMLILANVVASGQRSVLDGQTPPPSHQVTLTRDPVAIALLEKSLLAQGGKAQWGAVNSAHLHGTTGKQGDETSFSSTHIEYDWANLVLRSRVETKGAKHLVRLSTPEDGVHVEVDGSTKDMSSKVPTRTLPPELPAVAFLIALGDPNYSINLIPGPSLLPQGIRIMQFKADGPVVNNTQDWYISRDTSLPDHVNTYARDLFHKESLLRTMLSFVSYQAYGAQKVPAEIDIRSFPGSTRVLNIKSVTMGTAAPTTDFQTSQGVSQ